MERKDEKRFGVKPEKLDSQEAVLEIFQEFGPMDVERFIDSPPKVKHTKHAKAICLFEFPP